MKTAIILLSFVALTLQADDKTQETITTEPSARIQRSFLRQPNFSPFFGFNQCKVSGEFKNICSNSYSKDEFEVKTDEDKKYKKCLPDANCQLVQGKCKFVQSQKFRECSKKVKQEIEQEKKIKEMADNLAKTLAEIEKQKQRKEEEEKKRKEKKNQKKKNRKFYYGQQMGYNMNTRFPSNMYYNSEMVSNGNGVGVAVDAQGIPMTSNYYYYQ